MEELARGLQHSILFRAVLIECVKLRPLATSGQGGGGGGGGALVGRGSQDLAKETHPGSYEEGSSLQVKKKKVGGD